MMHFPWIVKHPMKRKAFKLKKRHSARTDILTQFDASDPAFSRQNTGGVLEVFFSGKLGKVLQFMELREVSALVLPIKQIFLNPPKKPWLSWWNDTVFFSLTFLDSQMSKNHLHGLNKRKTLSQRLMELHFLSPAPLDSLDSGASS